MFVVILFLLGLAFGYATKLPLALVAFVVPLLLALAATNRSGAAIVVGFAVTGIGILVGLVLNTRADERTA
jgi:hypothetical protein